MPTPTYDGASFEEDQLSEADRKLGVQFFYDAVQNNFKSAQEGRPIFDEIAMVRIFTPGSRDVMVTKANEHYKRRFERQWEKFQKQQSQVVDGTPLDQVPFLNVGQIAELKAVNCLTLEQLAEMSDVLAGKMMGMHGLRQRAQAYLSAAKGAAPALQLQRELEQRDNEIATLKQQIAELSAAIKAAPVKKAA